MIHNRKIPSGYNAVANVIKKRIDNNRKKAKQIARSEKRGYDDEVSDYELYRYLGMTFPDSPFGTIIKK